VHPHPHHAACPFHVSPLCVLRPPFSCACPHSIYVQISNN
jgi:hypothetical protein